MHSASVDLLKTLCICGNTDSNLANFNTTLSFSCQKRRMTPTKHTYQMFTHDVLNFGNKNVLVLPHTKTVSTDTVCLICIRISASNLCLLISGFVADGEGQTLLILFPIWLSLTVLFSLKLRDCFSPFCYIFTHY